MSDHKPDANDIQDDALDQVLRRAARSEVDAARIERLDRQWREISRRRVRTQTWFAVTLTVSLALGCVLAIRGFHLAGNERPPMARNDRVDRTQVEGDASLRHVASDDEAEVSAFDRLLCVAVQRRTRERVDQAFIIETQQAEPLDELLMTMRQRIGDELKVDDLVELFREQSSEELLLKWMETNDDRPSIDTGLQLLSFVATSRSLPALYRLRTHPRHYAAATRIISRQVDERTLYRLAAREANAALSRELAAELLRRSTAQSLFLYLELVNDRRTSPSALAAVADVEDLPLDPLYACLSARSRKVRLTAAMVLGRRNDPQVSAHLVQLLSVSRSGRAAMVALVASRDDAARRFVDQARRDIYLAATVNAAQSVVSSFRLEG